MTQIFETAESDQAETGKSARLRKMYMVIGTREEPEVRALVFATSPKTYESLTRQRIAHDHLGNNVWTCSVDYMYGDFQTDQNPMAGGGGGGPGGGGGGGGGGGNDGHQTGGNDPLGPHVTFDVGGRSQHVTSSLQTLQKKKKTGDSRAVSDHEGAIGVSKNGVEGCDIQVPAFTWSETWKFNPLFISWNYIRYRLRDFAFRVNGVSEDLTYDGTFRGFPPGEVMFLGATGEAEGFEFVKITYRFAAEENLTAVKLTPDFETFDKNGHEYVWVEYEDDTDVNNPIKVPRAVFVEEVGRQSDVVDAENFLNRRDFRFLGIGR